jgi:hypothetical protein
MTGTWCGFSLLKTPPDSSPRFSSYLYSDLSSTSSDAGNQYSLLPKGSCLDEPDLKNHISQKPQDRLLSLSRPQPETGTKESFRWYTARVRASYPPFPCKGTVPNLLSHPTFCEAMKRGILPLALSTIVGVHQSDFM